MYHESNQSFLHVGFISFALLFSSRVQAELVNYVSLDSINGLSKPNPKFGESNDTLITMEGAKFGGAARLDGSGDFLQVLSGVHPSIIGAADRTVSVWAKPDISNRHMTLLGLHGLNTIVNGSKWDLELIGPGGVEVGVHGARAYDSGSTSVGDWHLMTATFPVGTGATVTNIQTYLDGNVRANTFSSSQVVNSQTERFLIGTSANYWINGTSPYYFSGMIDDVAIWNEVLSQEEIQGLYDVAENSALQYTAVQFDRLKQVHDSKGGSTIIGGYQWTYATELNGPVGLSETSEGYLLILSGAMRSGLVGMQLSEPYITSQPLSSTNQIGGLATMSVTAVGSEPLAYQWYFSETPIPGVTGTNLIISPLSLADAGYYSVVVSNSFGLATSAVARLTVNRPPLLASTSIVVVQDQSISLPKINLLSELSDPDGDPLNITATSSISAKGGSVTLATHYIHYAPSNAYVGQDEFACTVTDSRGGYAQLTVNVAVLSTNAASAHVIDGPILTNGNFVVRVEAVLGIRYAIEYADKLNPPQWRPLTNFTLPVTSLDLATGVQEFIDPIRTNSSRFYRIRPEADRPPNVVIILADDLGYSDMGSYGGEINTPNLDRLASNGIRLTQMYNTARCWPTRASLLTGYYAQQVNRDPVNGDKPGNRPAWAALLPALLHDQGYRNYHSGKWHLDGKTLPAGFDRSYRVDDLDRYFTPRTHYLDDMPLPPVEIEAGYYATTEMTQYAIDFLTEHKNLHNGKPFFLYLAPSAPHFPLHAKAEDIARYANRYAGGWDLTRTNRWQRMIEKGVVLCELSPMETNIGPPYSFPDALVRLGSNETNRPVPWVELSSEQRDFQAQKMTVHAAMIDRLDREIGRVIDHLKLMNEFENTIIFFMSDNGASAEIMIRGDGHDPLAEPGSAATFLCLGPGWSSASNTPFRRHKTWVHEGGISTPLIIHWPRGFAARGELRHTPAHVIDLVPTVLELARIATPSSWNHTPRPPLPGFSLVPLFKGDVELPREELFWSHEGNRALRVGNWKIVADSQDPNQWALYNLANDRSEQKDLSLSNADRVTAMSLRWNQLSAQMAGQ